MFAAGAGLVFNESAHDARDHRRCSRFRRTHAFGYFPKHFARSATLAAHGRISLCSYHGSISGRLIPIFVRFRREIHQL